MDFDTFKNLPFNELLAYIEHSYNKVDVYRRRDWTVPILLTGNYDVSIALQKWTLGEELNFSKIKEFYHPLSEINLNELYKVIRNIQLIYS
jgi:hypothetical protein